MTNIIIAKAPRGGRKQTANIMLWALDMATRQTSKSRGSLREAQIVLFTSAKMISQPAH